MCFPSFKSISSYWDLCSIDCALNHPVNAVRCLSYNTPLYTCHMRSLFKSRRLEDEVFLRRVICPVFGECLLGA
jgi:hypothetical protein